MASYRFLNERNFRYFFQGLTLDSNDMGVLDIALLELDKQTKLPSRIVEHNAINGYGPPITPKGPQYIIDLTRYMTRDGRIISTAPVVKHNEWQDKPPAVHVNLKSPSQNIPQRVEVALRYLLKGLPNIEGTHMVYLHALKMEDPFNHEITDYVYYGVTKRGWMKRFAEHMKDALSDSPLLFHSILREGIYSRTQQLVGEPVTGRILVGNYHVVCVAGISEEQAMDAEEYLVEKHSFGRPKGLNMIPGGKAGIAYLHKLNILPDNKPVALDEDRERFLGNYLREHPRKGLPNPLIAVHWKDDDFAARAICGAENRLTIEQVRHIRAWSAEGYTLERICQELGTSNALQVRRVLEGKTYSRVH